MSGARRSALSASTRGRVYEGVQPTSPYCNAGTRAATTDLALQSTPMENAGSLRDRRSDGETG